MREITCIQVDITTACDRACPDCCCAINMGKRPAVHHPWSYFERLAPFIQGIDRVDLFGGEPTVHPQFAEFLPRFKDLFGCRILTMTTDGFRTTRHREMIVRHLDFVQISDYGDNAGAIAALRVSHADVRIFDGRFIPRSRRAGGRPCHRAFSASVGYADGKFWPCCPGPGIDGATGFEPSMDWREKMQAWPMPCGDCFMSEAA